ncbi:MAG: restriction endonuclease, partial [Planctomycetota bacterium]
MPKAWMVRAGEGGEVIDDFARGFVALGWRELSDLSNATSRETIRAMYLHAFPGHKAGKSFGAIAMLFKFRSVLRQGDKVVSYDPRSREYLVGTIDSDYFYDLAPIPEYPHLRKVSWEGRVSRDKLPVASRNSLGGALTLFAVDDEVWTSIVSALGADATIPEQPVTEEKAELEESHEDTVAKAHELIKDQVIHLDDSELEHLTAALLRAMGYRTRVSAKGPDRGVDVFASPDGLGLQEPRIKVEVKHRPKTAMGSQDLRSFLGGLRDGDRGLYVSTGGFTKEAGYEAERSKVPV